eukprot:CAMPEP_0171045618 /NCGR_PEP_ID=MMETSP0736-20130129/48893_1 /TAXON_ID=186038 /ORGANISM="Fragilariopsis kerguelensis, Strain L26-C5" /LENGTH=115 /DNA_ID=CAMNT_0011496195 /DNA_START=32 /DNA_END=375 /DNA_ORIENTATION=-
MSSSESERNAVRKDELIRHISSRTAGKGFNYDDVMKSLELDDDDDDDDHDDDDDARNEESENGTDADKIDSNSNTHNHKKKKKKTHRLHKKSHMHENEEFVNGDNNVTCYDGLIL